VAKLSASTQAWIVTVMGAGWQFYHAVSWIQEADMSKRDGVFLSFFVFGPMVFIPALWFSLVERAYRRIHPFHYWVGVIFGFSPAWMYCLWLSYVFIRYPSL